MTLPDDADCPEQIAMVHPILQTQCMKCRLDIENPRIVDLSDDSRGPNMAAYFCEHCGYEYANWPRAL